MNKLEILEKLSHLDLDRDKYIVIGGAALVLRNIVENTQDIDLATSHAYYDKVDWPTKMGHFGLEIKCEDCFEIGYNLYFENEYEVIDGYKVININRILEEKIALKRKKDEKVIQLLRDMIDNSKKEYCMIEIAFSDEDELNAVVDMLLDKRLVSGCQVVNSNSKWRLNGEIEKSLEYLLFVKTEKSLISKIYEVVKKIHSYECFEFAVFDMSSCNHDYLRWIDRETV